MVATLFPKLLECVGSETDTSAWNIPDNLNTKASVQQALAVIDEAARSAGELRIPVKWALDSGDVGRRRSEATLVEFYSSQVAHMSQEKGK